MFYWTQNMLYKIISFVDNEYDKSCSKEYLKRENQFELFGDIVGRNTTV